MPDAAKRPTAAPPADVESGSRRRTGVRYALRWQGRQFLLPEGQTRIGRNPNCQVVLDSPLVSRKHARLVVSGTTVVVEDFGSRNGVLVNGTLISGGVTVLAGDRIQIGDQQLELVQPAEDEAGEAGNRGDPRAAKTIEFDAAEPLKSEERTSSAHAFELLAPVVDKALALGQADEAERLLAKHLQRVLRDVESQERLPPEVPEAAVRFAVRLAEVTRKAGWINYSIRVYFALERPLPMETVHELYTLLRKVRGVDVSLLRKYVALLRSRASELGPTERFVAKRIEGLTTLTGL